jgi:hypothetical protein
MKLSRKQRAEIRRQAAVPVRMADIARNVGVSVAAVRFAIQKQSVTRQELIRLRRRGLSLTAAAARCFMTSYIAAKILKKHRRTRAAKRSSANAPPEPADARYIKMASKVSELCGGKLPAIDDAKLAAAVVELLPCVADQTPGVRATFTVELSEALQTIRLSQTGWKN